MALRAPTRQPATIHIQDLLVRTIVGIHDWERETEQDVIINCRLTYDAGKAVLSDAIEDTVDYMQLKKKIMAAVEQSAPHLLETLAAKVLSLALEDKKITHAWVRVDKPGALRFARSVAVEMEADRSKTREKRPRKK